MGASVLTCLPDPIYRLFVHESEKVALKAKNRLFLCAHRWQHLPASVSYGSVSDCHTKKIQFSGSVG